MNVDTLSGYPGLHPAKSMQSMPPDVHVGMGLGTVHPLFVPCSIAMNFAPFMLCFVGYPGAVVSFIIPVDCIQAIGSCDLGGDVDVVVGRRHADAGANDLLTSHGQRVAVHAAEAEPEHEDTRFVDASVLFNEGENVVEQRDVLQSPAAV